MPTKKNKASNSDEARTIPEASTEFIPAKPNMRTVNLDLSTTKRLVGTILDMPAEEASQLLRDQIMTKMLLINDQILKWLEVLDGSDDWKQRAEASAHVERLTACAAEITKNKLALDKALGAEMLPLLAPNSPPTLGLEEGEISEDEFMKMAKEDASITGNSPPAKFGHA